MLVAEGFRPPAKVAPQWKYTLRAGARSRILLELKKPGEQAFATTGQRMQSSDQAFNLKARNILYGTYGSLVLCVCNFCFKNECSIYHTRLAQLF